MVGQTMVAATNPNHVMKTIKVMAFAILSTTMKTATLTMVTAVKRTQRMDGMDIAATNVTALKTLNLKTTGLQANVKRRRKNATR